jgi:hypothetical protein
MFERLLRYGSLISFEFLSQNSIGHKLYSPELTSGKNSYYHTVCIASPGFCDALPPHLNLFFLRLQLSGLSIHLKKIMRSFINKEIYFYAFILNSGQKVTAKNS